MQQGSRRSLKSCSHSDDVNTTDEDLENVANDAEWSSESTAHLLPPILYGFSFVHKKWGEFSVDRLREIEWSSAPFNHLVLPPAYRNVVKSLIEIHSSDKRHQLVSDVVQGKSSGCIIALYGNPGCGKVCEPHWKMSLSLSCGGCIDTHC